MNKPKESYDIAEFEIDIIEKLIKCYEFCVKMRPKDKNKIIFDYQQAKDAGFGEIEEDDYLIRIMDTLKNDRIIKTIKTHDPDDYINSSEEAKFPGRIEICVYDNFIETAGNRIIELNKKIKNKRNNKILIYYSLTSGEIRTTEKKEPSTSAILINNRRKKLFEILYFKYCRKEEGGLPAKELNKYLKYTGDYYKNSIHESIEEINNRVKSELKKSEKIIINDGGYKINSARYEIIRCDLDSIQP